MIASHRVEGGRHRQEFRDAIRLALIPVGIALLLAALLAPRHAIPSAIPLPVADLGRVAHTIRLDRDRAVRVGRNPLPGPTRALGSAIRDFHAAEARGADPSSIADARRRLDIAVMEVLSGPDSGRDQLLDLRASQLDSFMAEIRRFQTTGASSTELSDLAGNFIQTMTADGWFRDRVLLADDDVLRVMFKEMWTALIGLQRREDLAVTLDEQRVLYAFYLQYPHPSRAMREAIGTARNGLSSRADRSSDRVAIEAWRIDRINRLAAIDSTYPTEYARGISQYRSGAFAASAAAFRAWLQLHPDGPWTMRARNYLLAAERAQLPD